MQATVRDTPRRTLPLLMVVFLLIAAILQCAAFWRTKSITIDETFYWSCALQTVQDARIDQRLIHAGTAPIGALLSNLPAAIAEGGQDRQDPWEGQADDSSTVPVARVVHALVTAVPLVLISFFWLRRRHGDLAGITGASLLAFSPTIIAHSALATTDAVAAVASVLAVLALSRDRDIQTWKTKGLVIVMVALAISTKYSGLFLLPVALVCFFIDGARRSESDLLARRLGTAAYQALPHTILLTLAVLVVVWVLHGFQLVNIPGRSLAETPRLLRPAPVYGIARQLVHNQAGHHAYLMGEFSLTGWWYYFPVATALKSTPAELVLLLCVLPVAMWKCLFGDRKTDLAVQTLAIGIAVMLALAVRSQINIGYRYLLPIFPMAILVAVDQLWHSFSSRAASLKCACGLLIAVQIGSSLWAAPHYLSYITPFVGGPSRGGDYLIDSNLDWGQDLPLLKHEVDRLGHRRLLLHYFGTAAPEAYGIEYGWLEEVAAEKWDEYDAVAVSETLIRGGYSYGRDPFEHLRTHTPQAWAGHSMRIYDLADEQVRLDLREAQRRGLQKMQ